MVARDLHTFEHVVVTPFTDLLDSPRGRSDHQGGPHWPEFDRCTFERHWKADRPADLSPLPPTHEPVAFPGAWAWAGPVVEHYGHQLGEFGMRLLPTLLAWPKARFLFASRAGDPMRDWDDVPPFLTQITRWLGIADAHCHLITSPVTVESLTVAAQGGQLDGQEPPAPWLLDALDVITMARLGRVRKSGIVFVTRAGILPRLGSEAYVARLLADAGVRVISPETMPIEHQLRHMASAERIVVTEGSALHTPQLLGRALGDVVVLRRTARPLMRARPFLEARARSYVDVTIPSAHLVPRPFANGREETSAGLALVDEGGWLDALPSLLGDDLLAARVRQRWRHHEWREQMDTDLHAWCEWAGRDVVPDASAVEHLLAQLPAAGLGPRADEIASWLTASNRGGTAVILSREEEAREAARYQQAQRELAALVRHAGTGISERVLVVGRGDVDELTAKGLDAHPFPSGPDGRWIGFHPRDSAEAVARLEAAAGDGTVLLALPDDSRWWLECYPGLAAYLARTATCLGDRDGAGVVFALHRPSTRL